MSHPNPSHDNSNEYPEDKSTHYKKSSKIAKVEVYKPKLYKHVKKWSKSIDKALKGKQN